MACMHLEMGILLFDGKLCKLGSRQWLGDFDVAGATATACAPVAMSAGLLATSLARTVRRHRPRDTLPRLPVHTSARLPSGLRVSN